MVSLVLTTELSQPVRVAAATNEASQPARNARTGRQRSGPAVTHRDYTRLRMEQSLAVKTFEELFAVSWGAGTHQTCGQCDSGRAGRGRTTRKEDSRGSRRGGWRQNMNPMRLSPEKSSQLLYWTQVLMIAPRARPRRDLSEAVDGHHIARRGPEQGPSESAAEILAEAGYRRRTDPKDLTVLDPVNGVEFFSLRPKGHRDLRWVQASSISVSLAAIWPPSPVRRFASGWPWDSVLQLRRYAAPIGREWTAADLAGKRIATAYPNLVRKDLAGQRD